jgi:hypothetical protein
MRVGMYEVREQLVHLAEGRFSLTGRGRYYISLIKILSYAPNFVHAAVRATEWDVLFSLSEPRSKH